MKLITAIIQRRKLDDVTEALVGQGVGGMTVTDAMGHGAQKGRKEVFRGKTYETDLLPKTRIEVIVNDEAAEDIIYTIVGAAKTGEGTIGDGKVWATPISTVVRVRTGERGTDAL